MSLSIKQRARKAGMKIKDFRAAIERARKLRKELNTKPRKPRVNKIVTPPEVYTITASITVHVRRTDSGYEYFNQRQKSWLKIDMAGIKRLEKKFPILWNEPEKKKAGS